LLRLSLGGNREAGASCFTELTPCLGDNLLMGASILGFGRVVADPDITPFSGYVRVGGNPTGTRKSSNRSLYECIGDDAFTENHY
jgi:hypothetical protein